MTISRVRAAAVVLVLLGLAATPGAGTLFIVVVLLLGLSAFERSDFTVVVHADGVEVRGAPTILRGSAIMRLGHPIVVKMEHRLGSPTGSVLAGHLVMLREGQVVARLANVVLEDHEFVELCQAVDLWGRGP